MKLYCCPQTRSLRPRWMLEELGVPYELVVVDLSKGEHKRPEYLKVHPMGVVPALEDGEHTFIESVAICQYLADKYPEKGLAPQPGTPERGEYYQWMMFAMTTVEPPLVDAFMHTRFLPEAQRQPAVAEQGRKRFFEVARVLEERLRGREFIVGNGFTAADVVMAQMLGWGQVLGLMADFPGLTAYVARHTARPAAQRAMA
jgi:glutathione S-transferase